MTNNQETKRRAEAKQNEPVLFIRMVWIGDEKGTLIEEDRRRLLEGNLVFPYVGGILRRIPVEMDAHKLHCNAIVGHRQGNLTDEANRPRLHRDAERSRESKNKKEQTGPCRRGPS